MANDRIALSFDTLDEAKQYFFDQGWSAKYDSLICSIGGRPTLLMGSGMVEDSDIRGPIEQTIQEWLESAGIHGFESEETAIDLGAVLCETMYNYLEKYNILDVEFAYDEY